MEDIELYYELPCQNENLWQQILDILSQKCENPAQLQDIIQKLGQLTKKNTRHMINDKYDLKGLSHTIQIFDQENDSDGLFMSKILPYIICDAIDSKELFKAQDHKIKLLVQNKSDSLIFTREQARSLIALGFFECLIHTMDQPSMKNYQKYEFGELNFIRLLYHNDNESVQRIKCLFYYFQFMMENQVPGNVCFYRKTLVETPDFQNNDSKITIKVNISSKKRIEDSDALYQVDFANQYLQIHQNIPSLTQEEVIFTLRPECYLGLFLTAKMEKNESIIIQGAKRICEYVGYLETFQYVGKPNATMNFSRMQFENFHFNRDLTKAYAGFQGINEEYNDYQFKYLNKNKISTGNWGCGVFNGDYYLKFLQQVIVAQVLGMDLDYSTFKNEILEKDLLKMWKLIKDNQFTVQDLVRFVYEYAQNLDKQDQFRFYIFNKLEKSNFLSQFNFKEKTKQIVQLDNQEDKILKEFEDNQTNEID